MTRHLALKAAASALALASLAACGGGDTAESAAAPAAAEDVTTITTPGGLDVTYTPSLHESPPYRTLHDTLWLMENVVQPSADVFWGSAGYVIDINGEHSLLPTTDEAWANVVTHAAIVAELGNLLMTPPYSEGRGDDWFQFAASLSEIGMRAQAAAEARSEDDIFEVGAVMDRVCEACHISYQDPNKLYGLPPGAPNALEVDAALDAAGIPDASEDTAD